MVLNDIQLKEITRDNYEDVCDLDVADEQQDYVASNTWSIVQSVFNADYYARAIYLKEKPVGFAMWVKETDNIVSVWRFMIDQHFQNQGIGQRAFVSVLAEIKAAINPVKITLGYNPDNQIARKFYAAFGFVETGMDHDGDDMLAEIICRSDNDISSLSLVQR